MPRTPPPPPPERQKRLFLRAPPPSPAEKFSGSVHSWFIITSVNQELYLLADDELLTWIRFVRQAQGLHIGGIQNDGSVAYSDGNVGHLRKLFHVLTNTRLFIHNHDVSI